MSAKTGRTVNLGVLVGDHIVYLIRLRNADLVTENLHVGSSLPAAFTSMGKVLLAALADKALEQALERFSPSEGVGPNAIQTARELKEALGEVRRGGFAMQNEEVAPGLRSIAAGVVDDAGATVAAINIVCPAVTIGADRMRTQYLPVVQEAASMLSARLGHRAAV